jgi:hypothetical protein
MTDGAWLTKSQVNALYYNTVAGEISFVTEASVGSHPGSVARLIAHHALSLGRTHIRVLEIGANDCGFARELIRDLRKRRQSGEAGLDRVDYLAVEYARPSLEAVVGWEARHGAFDRVIRGPGSTAGGGTGPPERPSLVALAVLEDEFTVNLGLVHAEAVQFVRTKTEPFDFVIMNELLDDMPCRVYFADGAGRRFEAVPRCRSEGERWAVRVAAEDPVGAELAGLAPRTITAESAEWVELVSGVVDGLESGGMLLVHDYGFAELRTSLDPYDGPPGSLPSFATIEFSAPGSEPFPRRFFRVFGNEALKVVQVTNDVNFAQLAHVLEGSGQVLTIPHGNAIPAGWGRFAKGDGVFLAEFDLLEPDDDLPSLLARLRADQAEIRSRYVHEYTGGRGNVFLDLVYVKD